MITAQVVRDLPLSAASGLVIQGQYFYVVADDALHLGVFRLDDADYFQPLRLLAGELPAEKKARKAAKPDFETLLLWPACSDYPFGALLVLGSGSTAQRQQAVLLPFDEQGELSNTVITLNLAPLYTALALADCNIEGAVICGEQLVLLQRGNRQQTSALVITNTKTFPASSDVKMIPVALPVIDGIPCAFTDGLCLPNGNILFSAVAEATDDSYNDGACLGAIIGEVSLQGDVLRYQRVSGTCKIEGIALAQDMQRLYAVTDADDPAVAAQLLFLDGWR